MSARKLEAIIVEPPRKRRGFKEPLAQVVMFDAPGLAAKLKDAKINRVKLFDAGTDRDLYVATIIGRFVPKLVSRGVVLATRKEVEKRIGRVDRMVWFEAFVKVIRSRGNEIILEHRFRPDRKWALDVAINSVNRMKVGIEIQGLSGRHQTTAGFLRDLEKHNEAMIAGWQMLYVTWAQIRSGDALDYLARFGVPISRK